MIEGIDVRATFVFDFNAPTGESGHANFRDLRRGEFFDLVVEERGPNAKDGGARWWCRCKCGKRKLVRSNNLLRGSTKSCGCRKGRHWRERVAREKAAGHHRYRVNR